MSYYACYNMAPISQIATSTVYSIHIAPSKRHRGVVKMLPQNGADYQSAMKTVGRHDTLYHKMDIRMLCNFCYQTGLMCQSAMKTVIRHYLLHHTMDIRMM